MVVETDNEDEAFRRFQDWLIECEEVTAIWACGWALGQDGKDLATRSQRAEAIDESTLQQSMAPDDLGAPELGVASVRPRMLAIEFCGKQDGGEWQGRRFVEEGRGEEERWSEMEREVRYLKKKVGVGMLGGHNVMSEDADNVMADGCQMDAESARVDSAKGMTAWMMCDARLERKNQNEDAMVACLLAYLIYCTAENKCYLLREEKMAILIVLKYGRRLDP